LSLMGKVNCRRSLWAFCYAKKKNLAKARVAPEGAGDVWTWTGICTDTKLVPSWLVGTRDADHGKAFMEDLASRMKGRIQLTSDGYKPYLEAVEGAFGLDIDYAQLVKMYGVAKDGSDNRKQYIGSLRERISGNPDPTQISTSYVERQNLTMRMSIRRFTRKTNAFSKKIENHKHAIALHYMYYNFARIHKSLRVTPAMEAGIADHVWSLADIITRVR
jgi:IS1 family transposase